MVINLVPGGGLTGNADALAAFSRAAHSWEALFTDPITVTISANLQSLAPGTIGSSSSVTISGSYSDIRNAMASDALGEPTQTIASALPTAAQFSTSLPSGFTYNGSISLTKANAKALNFTGLDSLYGDGDATITFNSGFAFDYDSSDGVTTGQMDFQTVAAHEIGHALGFFSMVDTVDGLSPPSAVSVSTLDLFRFSALTAPATLDQFTALARQMTPGQAAVFADTFDTYSFSTGRVSGDGQQASHWKDDVLTGTYIGLMDPTLSYGVAQSITLADRRAFDLIGYDLVAPEPATFALAALALLAFVLSKRSLRPSR